MNDKAVKEAVWGSTTYFILWNRLGNSPHAPQLLITATHARAFRQEMEKGEISCL